MYSYRIVFNILWYSLCLDEYCKSKQIVSLSVFIEYLHEIAGWYEEEQLCI